MLEFVKNAEKASVSSKLPLLWSWHSFSFQKVKPPPAEKSLPLQHLLACYLSVSSDKCRSGWKCHLPFLLPRKRSDADIVVSLSEISDQHSCTLSAWFAFTKFMWWNCRNVKRLWMIWGLQEWNAGSSLLVSHQCIVECMTYYICMYHT